MKKIIIAALSICLVISASAFAPNKKAKSLINPKLESNFIQEFGDMQNVTWSEAPNDMIRATFKIEQQTAEAYFDTEGNYVCTTTVIEKENLPLKLRAAISKKFEGAGINAILQSDSSEGTRYYIQTTDEKGTKIWKGSSDGSIELFKKL